MNVVRVYTLWASMPDDVSPWMIAAEDEFSWEGDPDRCEAVFDQTRAKAKASNWQTREITLLVALDEIDAAFLPKEIAVETEAAA